MKWNNLRTISLMGLIVLISMNIAIADDSTFTQKNIVERIFTKLMLDQTYESLNLRDKAILLESMRLCPFEGYQIERPMPVVQFCVLTVRLYAIENELPKEYTANQAYTLLKQKMILTGDLTLESDILKTAAFQVIDNIPVETAIITHQEFVHHLFDHLDLVDRSTILSVTDKMEALKELNFQPREGYQLDQTLIYADLAIILTRIYGLEKELAPDYHPFDAIYLLVERKILPVAHNPLIRVSPDLAVTVINNIPRVPPYSQETILLPRYVEESPMSRCE
ncbi:hypothetical protein JW979_01060 [bacterium]|nr:hypothetical protein [candidate division CSSED10-310 bacterium]